jgi:enterochelin esterase family protein
MKKLFLTLSTIVILLVSCTSTLAPTNNATQNPTPLITKATLPFQTLAEFEAALDMAIRTDALDPFWETIVATGQMPLVFGQTAVFMYRGEANSVAWSADFAPGARWLEYMSGKRQGDSNLWMHKRDFPIDGRMSYRISINGNRKIILDPLNPYQNMEGSGPVSELRMPAYVPPKTIVPRNDINHGLVSNDVIIFNQASSYKVNYRVYTPAGYEQMQNLPTIYVVDGQEYAQDELGSMVIVLDNLIAEGAIEPIIAVFIDQREPETAINRRDQEFNSTTYEKFLVSELVPAIDVAYRTNPVPAKRAILGVCLGGIFVMRVGINHPDVFGLVAMQSPGPVLLPEDYAALSESANLLPLKFFISVGTIGDITIPSRLFQKILKEKGYPLLYVEVSDGHSWGHYRAQLDEMLGYFFDPENGR